MMGNSWISLLLASRTLAWQHHLYTSSFATPHLYALRFDDETNTLTNVANITAASGHPWLSFSYDKSSVYGGIDDGFASYLVENATSLVFSRNITIGADQCPGSKDSAGSPYVIAEQRTPFHVFGAPRDTCGAAISVDSEGTLNQVAQSFKYGESSSIKGLALDPENEFLYSADSKANGIWTHQINDEGKVKQVAFTPSPIPNSEPRKLVVHPNGRYLYVILSKTSSVLLYAINHGTGAQTQPLTYTGLSYSLLPEGP